ncbi:ABC transporter ATP-binding protein [Leifsonia poae]|uniref:ABC transporter ATP-binding protein n=1 Tax=Leifsonia poae TaxID=110933 RepID=UPI003D67332A
MTSPGPALAAVRLTRRFATGAGVTDVSLGIAPREIVALVGLNGAGKTTLMRLLLGMLRPTEGTAVLLGQTLAKIPQRTWSNIGHAIETSPGYPDLTVRRNLEISARLRGVRARQAAISVVVDEFDIGGYLSQNVRTLSMGNRQRAGLAAALVHDPRVIVLDEPTNALDPSGVIRLRESLLRRSADGAAILVSSHHLDEVARFADRILVMNRGRLIGELPPHTPELEHVLFETLRSDDAERGL